MRVHVVSDVHGAAAELRDAGSGADAFVCLGDLLLFLDYADHRRGLFAELFGADAATRLIELRTARRFDDAREFSTSLWGSLGDARGEVVENALRAQYAEMFAAMPTPAYATYGNVDVPTLFAECAPVGVRVLDGEVADIGGRRFGFVGGGLRTPMRTPNELSDEAFAAKVAAIGAVDVLCSHIPPAIPELLYDVAARRMERGSTALLEAVRATRPRLVLFGHVHNPLAARARVGGTECLNVGHFRARGTPYVLRW